MLGFAGRRPKHARMNNGHDLLNDNSTPVRHTPTSVEMIDVRHAILWVLGLQLCMPCVWSQEPVKITLCDIKDNPTRYDHNLVEVEGFVSHHFEDFSISTPECPYRPAIWLEFGGKTTSRTIYCCGVSANRMREKQLVVEGVEIPLVKDKQFRSFDKLIQPPFRSTNHGSIVHAALAGRFFLGEKLEYGSGGWDWGGYGHFGCCSLLVIQQVLSLDDQDRDDLDYGASLDQPDTEKFGCGGDRILTDWPSAKQALSIQQSAEAGESARFFDDPRHVAMNSLADLLKVDRASLTDMKEVRKNQGRAISTWRDPKRRLSYMLILSRPYWLSFLCEGSKEDRLDC